MKVISGLPGWGMGLSNHKGTQIKGGSGFSCEGLKNSYIWILNLKYTSVLFISGILDFFH